MEKTNGAYIVVDLDITVPEEMFDRYGLRELHLPDSLYIHAVGPLVNIVPENSSVTAETSYKDLSYHGTLVNFSNKFWTFDYDSPLGICVAAMIGTALTYGTTAIGDDKSCEITFVTETLKSFKGASILDTLFGILNATLSTKFYDVRTLCWYTDQTPLISLLLKENNGEKKHGALSHVETATGDRTKSFYNYVEGCESQSSSIDEIPEGAPAFPLKDCCFVGVKIDVRTTLSKIETSQQAETDTPEPKGIRLSDFDTPNFLRNVAREGIERAERSAERIRGRLDTRDSRDRRLTRNEDLEDDVRDIVRDLELVFNRVDRILSDMDTRVPAGAALAVTAILEEKVKEIQKVVSDARKDSLIIMLEKEISIGRGSSSFSLKEGLLELLDDQERNNSDRRDRRRVRSGYRGWAEVDCRRRDCDCEECQDDRRRRDRRDDRDRRSSHIRRKRW